jgi:hypothetical protein
MDDQFRRRMESTIQTVQAWDADPKLLSDCRQRIWQSSSFRNECLLLLQKNQESRWESCTQSFMQSFVRYFKDNIMIWCNAPSCTSCGTNGDNMESVGIREPTTASEILGQANRVEVYMCKTCHVETTFPRYNNVRTLFELSCHDSSKTPGRCGEYANLFGLYCRALGLETRYVLDYTDHVWIEVLMRMCSNETEQWCMLDSCEGVLNEYSMYEHGWGKKLSYIVAISTTCVTDVTTKYTRKFHDASFQERRRNITSSEYNGRAIIQNINQSLQSQISAKDSKMVQQRRKMEDEYLQYVLSLSNWDKEQQYQFGRISGNIAWKALRQEVGTSHQSGTNTPTTAPTEQKLLHNFYVESYDTSYNTDDEDFVIYIQPPVYHQHDNPYCHDMIRVNNVACAVGCIQTLSVVVLDENFTDSIGGCILQSQCCASLFELVHFVSTIPAQRIVIIVGTIPPIDATTPTVTSDERELLLLELGNHFCIEYMDQGITYIGQILVKDQPSWSYCGRYDSASCGIKIQTRNKDEMTVGCHRTDQLTKRDRRLRTFRNVRPRAVIGRVSDTVMPFATQLEAGYTKKRSAFLSYVEQNPSTRCYGYTTKSGSPIYLLGTTSYPLIQSSSNHDHDDDLCDCWNTFILLPPVLVPTDDHGITDDLERTNTTQAPSSSTLYEVPLDETFFKNELGRQLLIHGSNLIPTVDALCNTRLVAYYFSAHWCPRTSYKCHYS